LPEFWHFLQFVHQVLAMQESHPEKTVHIPATTVPCTVDRPFLDAVDESYRASGESQCRLGEKAMIIALTTVCTIALLTAVLVKRARDQHEMEQYSITPEVLHGLLASNQDVLVIDVRHPLDLLADLVIIPGAKWVAPREVLENPSLIPREKELVVYCTCPTDKTSRTVLHRALAKGYLRIKFLKGGLEGWRAKGFPVEPYEKPFHLDSDSSSHLAAAG
jgi:rhodanese-related sulfurtransferase